MLRGHSLSNILLFLFCVKFHLFIACPLTCISPYFALAHLTLLDHFFPRAQSLSHQSHQAGRLYANSGADVTPSAVLLWPLQRVV